MAFTLWASPFWALVNNLYVYCLDVMPRCNVSRGPTDRYTAATNTRLSASCIPVVLIYGCIILLPSVIQAIRSELAHILPRFVHLEW